MDQDMITDITLDHLPDLSDASVSFQIPPNNASADLLLADNAGEFDVLCNAVDDDVSFAPVALMHPRGQPLTLDELTPRVQRVQGTPRSHLDRPPSPTASKMPPSSAKPSVIQYPLTLGHRSSPDKPRKTPSRPKSIRRQPESPLVSSERFHQLCAEVESLDQAHEPLSHAPMHVMKVDMVEGENCSPPHINSKTNNDALDIPPPSEDFLDPIPEEKEISQDVEPSAVQDIVMATGDNCPDEATNTAVAAPLPKSKRNPRTNSKPTVAAGGISKRAAPPTTHVSKKTKGKSFRVGEAHPVPPSTTRQPHKPPQSIDAEEDLVPPACMSGDIDSMPESTQITQPSTSGLAERLVSYSQKLISSIGLYKPSPENSFVEVSNDAVGVGDTRVETRLPAASSPPSQRIDDISDTHSEPLRLSEISPRKRPINSPKRSSPTRTGTVQDGGPCAMSPMRPGKKRASIDEDQLQEYQRQERERMIRTNAHSERGSLNEAVSQRQARPAKKTRVHEDQSVAHPEICDSAQHPDTLGSTLPSARTKYKPKLTSYQYKGPTLDALPYSSSSRQRQVHGRMSQDKGRHDKWRSKAASVRSESSSAGFGASSCVRHDKRTRQETAIELSYTPERSGPTSAANLPLIERKPNATLSVAQLTKPVGFTFRVDARLEARKGEGRLAVSEPGKTHPIHPVPDVKAHRASHHAAFTFHREGVVPSVPVAPFVFCTEQRAKEREKFDDMVKRKEEEMQRLKEEQRRRETEEEERAIKELRRKAVPKANEIPEWYADMPKRKGRRCEVMVEGDAVN